METTKKKYIVALSFIAALLLFIWGFNFLKGKNIFSEERIYYAVYNEVNGLETANRVVINGLGVGQVKKMYFNPNMDRSIIVELSIQNKIPIPKNTVARIFSSDLMGSKNIKLILGNSTELAQSGDTLITSIENGLMEEVNKQVLPLKNKAESLLSSVDSVVVVLQTILNENARQNITNSLQNISTSFQNLETATANIDTLIFTERGRIGNILNNLEIITSDFKENGDNLNNIITNISNLSDTLTQADIYGTVQSIQTSFNKLDLLLAEINQGDGTLGMLIKNDSIYNEVDKTVEALKLLLEDIKTNPKRYVKFSVF